MKKLTAVFRGLLLVCPLLLTGCTAQAVPISQRAMVNAVYLEKEGNSYNALVAIRDFSNDTGNGNLVTQTAQGETAIQALQLAAAAAGGEPFFAQNQLLLLGDQIAETEWNEVCGALVRHLGDYRNPYVWVWRDGVAALQEMEALQEFIESANRLPQDYGCAATLLQLAADNGAAVLPVLECRTEQGRPTAAPGALQVCGAGESGSFTDTDLLCYGLLRGQQSELLLAVQTAGQGTVAVHFYGLGYLVEEAANGLQIKITGKGIVQDGDKTQELCRQAQLQLAEACASCRSKLLRQQIECPNLEWWKKYYGLREQDFRQLVLSADIRWE